MSKLHSCIAILACLLAISPAGASTTNQRLLILDAKQDRNAWILSVRGLLGGKVHMDIPGRLSVPSQSKIFLDGKKVTPEEAFKPGHSFRHQADSGYLECYSSDFRFPEAKTSGKHDGVYQLTLKGAGKAVQKVRHELRRDGFDVYLHLEIADGAVAGGGATGLYKKNQSIPSLPVDVSGLRLIDDRLHGPVIVTFLSLGARMPENGVGRLSKTYTLDVAFGEEISGGYTVGDNAGKGTVNGQRETLPARGADCTLYFWLRAPLGRNDGAHAGSGLVSLRFKDGTLADGLYSHAKWGATGLIKASTLKIDDNRVEGDVTYLDYGKSDKIWISGVLVGHQLFGECKLNDRHGRIRGGIRIFDCPPFMCWDEGTVKKWLNQHPDQPVPPEQILHGK